MACAWIALAVGFVLVMSTTADARSVSARLHIRQVSGERAFRGRVVSSRQVCVRVRRVRLYHEVTGHDPVVAHARTRADGTWRARVARAEYRPASYYYARVASKRVASTRCAAAKSAYAEAP